MDYTAFVKSQELHRAKSKRAYLGITPEEIAENYEDVENKIKHLKSKIKARGSLQVLMNTNRKPTLPHPLIDV